VLIHEVLAATKSPTSLWTVDQNVLEKDGRGGGIRRLASVIFHVSEFMGLPPQLAETKLFP
jgi:hypothetical protein